MQRAELGGRAVKPGKFAAWGVAVRLRSLTIAIVPVILGSAAAAGEGVPLDLAVALVALAAAVLIQAGTNLQNDLGDFQRGADAADRLGPPRATSQGWLSPREVRRGVQAAFGVALALGVYLVWAGGWPILVVGASSIAAGLAYTASPRPIAYTGLGELFVFVFFGLVAVSGSYYLQAHALGWPMVVAGAAVGSLAAAVLVVNNYRDIDGDRRVGKRTLAVCLGERFARLEYAVLVLAPFVAPPLAWLLGDAPARALPLVALPWALGLVRRIYATPRGAWLNQQLGETVSLQLAFGSLWALSLLVA